MALILKNTTGSSSQWGGLVVAATSQVTLQDADRLKLLSDPTFITDVGSGAAVINDGTGDVNSSTALTLLRFADSNIFSIGSGLTSTRQSSGLYLVDTVTSSNGLSSDSKFQIEDFLMSGATIDHSEYSPGTVLANGGTATVPDTTIGGDGSTMGVVTLATGATNNATGRGAIDTFGSTPWIKFGTKRFIFETYVRLPVLSGTPTYQALFGLSDGAVAGLQVNGLYAYYSSTVNTGKWRFTSRSSSASVNLDSTVTVNANQWYKLRMDVNAAANSIGCYIDDVFIGNITTGITTATLLMFAQIEKTSTSTTSRTANIDYFAWNLFR